MMNARNYVRLLALLFALACIGTATAADTVTYYHTDALGTPMMESNAAGTVTYTREHRPYGEQALGAAKHGPGFTGHVGDADTGLTYMQARYFDPISGRFLSNDPVAVDANNGVNYNRYWYANNNPYKFVDPDGRAVERVRDGKIEGEDTSVDLKAVVARPARASTEAIVVHRTVSSSASSAITSAVSTGGKASFHLVIDTDGSTTQISSLNNVANHVGRPTGNVSNQNSIGIEVVGNYSATNNSWDPLTPAQIEATAQAVYVIGKAYQVRNVSPHESVSRKTAGEGGVVMQAIGDRLNQLYQQGPPPFDSYLSGESR